MRRVFLWAAICSIVVPINGQKSTTESPKHQQTTANPQAPKNETIDVDTVNIGKLNIAQQTNPPGKPDKDANKPPSYFQRLFAPENLPNLILCFVGTAGVIAAICTLKAIRRQADIMDSQKDILKDSVTAAQNNAIAAREGAKAAQENINIFVGKERARLRITLKPLILSAPKFEGIYVVDFTVKNCGS